MTGTYRQGSFCSVSRPKRSLAQCDPLVLRRRGAFLGAHRMSVQWCWCAPPRASSPLPPMLGQVGQPSRTTRFRCPARAATEPNGGCRSATPWVPGIRRSGPDRRPQIRPGDHLPRQAAPRCPAQSGIASLPCAPPGLAWPRSRPATHSRKLLASWLSAALRFLRHPAPSLASLPPPVSSSASHLWRAPCAQPQFTVKLPTRPLFIALAGRSIFCAASPATQRFPSSVCPVGSLCGSRAGTRACRPEQRRPARRKGTRHRDRSARGP